MSTEINGPYGTILQDGLVPLKQKDDRPWTSPILVNYFKTACPNRLYDPWLKYYLAHLADQVKSTLKESNLKKIWIF